MPLDPDNSQVQCLATEVKTPDFKKAICGDDDTENEEDICVKSASTNDPKKHILMNFITICEVYFSCTIHTRAYA